MRRFVRRECSEFCRSTSTASSNHISDYAALVEAPKEEQEVELPKIPEYGFDLGKKGANALIEGNILSAVNEDTSGGTPVVIRIIRC